MRQVVLAIFLSLNLFAQKLEITDFQTDLYSKQNKDFSKKISLSMQLIGRDVFDESHKVIDSLNIIIGSFYAQDLLTSKGKEAFKKALIKYSSKKYSVEIDEIFIQQLFIVNTPMIQDFVKAMKESGCCKKCDIAPQKTQPEQSKNDKIDEKDDDIIIIE